MDESTSLPKIVTSAAAVLCAIFLIGILASATVVSVGERAVVVNLGSVEDVLDEGFYFVNPITNNVYTFEVRTVKDEVNVSAASKDLQTVSSVVAVNYNIQPENVGTLYENIGRDYKARIIDPAVQEAVKAATSKYTAEELITKRQKVRDDMLANISERLVKNGILVTDVSIVDFDFSESFNAAIEAKVQAEQVALAEKNNLEKVKYQAAQRIEQSKAEAEAIRIQAQAITQQGGEDYVRLKAIEKWNGALPTNMFGETAVPFVGASTK